MENFNLVVNFDSITMGKSGAITGEIYFEILDKYFPEKNWNDFIVIIFGWWVNNLKNFYERNENNFELCFMDGSFSISVKKRNENMLELNFLQYNGHRNVILFKIECLEKVLKRQILSAANKVLRKAEIENWSADPICGLRNGLNYIKGK